MSQQWMLTSPFTVAPVEKIAIARFDDIIIPGINLLRERGGQIADVSRTAGGMGRGDFVRAWREWEVRTNPIPVSVVDALRMRLNAIMWGYAPWWCYDMGNETPVMAHIPRDTFNVEMVRGLMDHRALSFHVIEQ